jgi:hypothetical protein
MSRAATLRYDGDNGFNAEQRGNRDETEKTKIFFPVLFSVTPLLRVEPVASVPSVTADAYSAQKPACSRRTAAMAASPRVEATPLAGHAGATAAGAACASITASSEAASARRS